MSLSASRIRLLAALMTAAAGVMNIISALYPGIPSRMEVVRDLLPMHLIRATSTATVLSGFCLILLADGLRRRSRRALVLAVGVLVASAVLNMTKGLDFEEASVALALAAFLLWKRDAFSVRNTAVIPSVLLSRGLQFAVMYYCYVLAGFLILRHAIYPAPSVTGVLLEPFRLLLGHGEYTYLTGHARWFDRSLKAIGSVGLLYGLIQIFRPLVPRVRPSTADLQHVHNIVRRFGSDTLSYFALQHGRRYFFHPMGDAFLSYRIWGRVALVGGDPIGPADALPELVSSFVEFADASGLEPCFLGVSAAQRGMYERLGLRTLKIGEEALIDLPQFDPSQLKRKVRRAVRHIAEAGIEAHTWRVSELPAGIRRQLELISHDWVEGKGGAERGFSMTLGRLPGPNDGDCEVTVALQDGTVWGYLCLAPVYAGNAWSLDAMRRRPDSPNGLMEFLVVQASLSYAARGYGALSLNFASLSNSLDDIDSRLLEGTRAFLYEHLSSMYQLKSLQQFNDKFLPRWSSRYLAYRGALQVPRLALAIVQCEDPFRLPSPLSLFRR